MPFSKYTVLAEYLLNTKEQEIKLSFSLIEKILGFPLPDSSFKFRSWWSNDFMHSHARNGWLKVGWRITDLDMTNQVVRLSRVAEVDPEILLKPPQKEKSRIQHARYFEAIARSQLSSYFGKPLKRYQFPKINHLFDFVSDDYQIVGESHYFSQKGKTVQHSKINAITESVWLLEKLTATHKFLIFGSSREVPQSWLEKYGTLNKEIKFYFLDDEATHLERLN
ncbi:MAG: hypothetical protein ACFE89_03535 [Candidatus Hodarchaeota archaeon]